MTFEQEREFYRKLSDRALDVEIGCLDLELMYLEDAENFGDEYEKIQDLLEIAEEEEKRRLQ